MPIQVGKAARCTTAVRWTAATVACASLLLAKGARAGDQPGLDVGRHEEAQVTVTDESNLRLEEDDNGVPRKLREPLFVGLDFLVGFGTYTAVEQGLPAPPGFLPADLLASTQIRTETFMLLAHYRFKKFGLGMRLPIIVGHIADVPTLQATGENVFNNGNLEFSFDMPRRLSPHVRYVPEVALTLPISSGSTPPYTQAALQANNPPSSANFQSLSDQYDRYAVGLAAAWARGGEDDALFMPWRLGITPKVAFDMRFNHTKVIPYVKIPIMISMEQNVNSVAGAPPVDEPLRIEAVGGVKVIQEIGPIQLGVRVVGMIPIAARTSLKTPMLSVWPEVRFQLTPSAQFWMSGMIPLAGDYNVFTDGTNGSFQAGLGATF